MKRIFISSYVAIAMLALPFSAGAQQPKPDIRIPTPVTSTFRDINAPQVPEIRIPTPVTTQFQSSGQSIFFLGTPSNSSFTPQASSGGGGEACSSLTRTGLKGVVACVISILGDITVVLIAATVVYIIWGAFRMITVEEKREEGRKTIMYGIIGLFVMISIWGLVNILDSTFKLQGDYIPAPRLGPR